MRKSIDGLCTIIEDQLKMDPSSSVLFLFCGRRRDRIKVLFREPDGFVLIYKRLSVPGGYQWLILLCRRGSFWYNENITSGRENDGIQCKGASTSESVVAWAMYQKYANGLPLYRQEKDWKQYGVQVSRTTLANWIIYYAQYYFQPLYDYFHRELLKRSFAMADETRVQVLHEEGRRAQSQSFMWLFQSGEDGLPVIILYGYSPTRSGSHAREFLKGYHGYLETDGYQGYNSLPGLKRCSCWAHIRRYFIDAVPKGKQYDYSQPAVQGVQYCSWLFAIEDSINKKYPGDHQRRKQLRLEKEKPVLEAFWSWLDQQRPQRSSRMDKAVTYVMNRRDTAETYLEDGRCSFTNNLSENAIHPFAVGRKNWLFSDSVNGANASAVVYTMVEMARAHDLNIYGYLKYLLEQRPSEEMTDAQLSELAPWSEKLQSIKDHK